MMLNGSTYCYNISTETKVQVFWSGCVNIFTPR